MNAPARHAAKQTALRQFERWAHAYDGSILQHVVFRPTYEVLLEEVTRWRREVDPGRQRTFDALDVGCGTGSWMAMLCGTGLANRAVGLDYSPKMCHRAIRKARDCGVSDLLGFVHADSEHLPLADASVDLVTCSHSFHHYPHQAAVVREMRRVLRAGGRLMIVDGFRDNVIGWFVFDVCVSGWERSVYHVPWRQMRTLFESAGFRDIRQRKFNVWAPGLATVGTA